MLCCLSHLHSVPMLCMTSKACNLKIRLSSWVCLILCCTSPVFTAQLNRTCSSLRFPELLIPLCRFSARAFGSAVDKRHHTDTIETGLSSLQLCLCALSAQDLAVIPEDLNRLLLTQAMYPVHGLLLHAQVPPWICASAKE